MEKKRRSIVHHTSSGGTIQLEITDSFIRAWNDRGNEDSVGKKGLLLRFVGVLCTGVSALLFSYRANYDGKLSFYGVILKIISFVIMSFSFVCDTRFTSHERCLYSAPKAFGIIMGLLQLYGIVSQNEEENIFLTI
jgi:hypothetical protein